MPFEKLEIKYNRKNAFSKYVCLSYKPVIHMHINCEVLLYCMTFNPIE